MSSDRYPPISDYALVADCHAAALVSRSGSIDWCCLPRFDSGSCFGRLLDRRRGGYCSIDPVEPVEESHREYLGPTMVLGTRLRTSTGQVRILDRFTMRRGGARRPRRELLRVVEGERGDVALDIRIVPRFDYGEVRPWLRRHADRTWSAIGGDDGLVVTGDVELEATEHGLVGSATVSCGERARLSLSFRAPELVDVEPPEPSESAQLDRRLEETLRWWRRWARRARIQGPEAAGALRSALVLKALTYAPTGAVAAAPTTSLPEAPGGSRNWDYRYSWIRDAVFGVRSLAELGYEAEADGFRRFAERSAAGHADELQVVYGVGGERRVTELELPHLEGYRGAQPVRIGNAATGQLQLDAYGELLNQTWRWFRRGHEPDEDDWGFLCDMVEVAVRRWREPDCGIWEWRGAPRHFVHSKALCWAAIDRGLRLARESGHRAPVRRWQRARREIRAAVERDGYDSGRGVFVQALGRRELDAALLLLPVTGFVDWEDERMVRGPGAARRRWAAATLRRGRARGKRGGVPGMLVLAGRVPRAPGPSARGAARLRPRLLDRL
ncbi:MAG: glycoside hydrolase family 15 protein [Solirubrobacteraceae bacterium]